MPAFRLARGVSTAVRGAVRTLGNLAYGPPVWSAPPVYTVSETQDVTYQLPVSLVGGGSMTVAWVSPGPQPNWVVLTGGTTPTIRFTGGAGQIDSADLANVILSASANGYTVNSSAGSITVTAQTAIVTFTKEIGPDVRVAGSGASEPAYNQANIAADGTFFWWCTGDHGTTNVDNAVHGFNPWTTSRVDAAGQTRSPLAGWLRWTTDLAQYVTQHDNRLHWNLRSAKLWITPGNGVYDLTDNNHSTAWKAGNYTPSTVNWKAYVKLMTQNDIDAGYFEGFLFNAHNVWVEALDCLFVCGGEASGTPPNYFWRVERTLPSEGFSEPWKITRFNPPAGVNPIGTSPAVGSTRNTSVAVGPYVYFACEDRRFWKIDVRDMVTATQLANVPAVGNNYYWLMTYDERRKKILWIGQFVYAYDLDTNTWSDITPVGWTPMYNVMGEYHNELDAHYFRAFSGYAYGDHNGGFQEHYWHKLYLGNPTTNPRWRSQTVGLSPFKGYIEVGYGQNKHVGLAWHPVKKRIYNGGGDFGYGATDFGQPGPSQTAATNQPGGRSYTITDSLRVDLYSIDPLAGGTADWRLEHPHYQQYQAGSPEQKPGFTDQIGWVWDARPAGIGGQKFWCFQHHIRDDQSNIPRFLADGVTLDPWANGDTFINSQGKIEGRGTYSWTPSANGGAGTWVKETVRYMWGDINYSTPAQVGDALRIYSGSPDHLYCGAWAQYKPASDGRFVSLFGDAYSTNVFWFVTFDPAGKTYDWRRVTFPASTLCWSWIGPMVVVDDYAYVTALTRQSGVRKSQLLKMHIPTALSYGAGQTLPSSLPQFVDCPFSFEPDGLWETQGTGGNLFHEVGLVGIDRKIVLIGSYGATLVKNGVTRLATYTPDTGRWIMADPFPGVQYNAKAWVAIPETGEILLMPNSSYDDTTQPYSPQNTYWYYRVR